MPDPRDLDPELFGRLLGDLAHASTSKLQPPRQSAQPPLADTHARDTGYETVGPPEPPRPVEPPMAVSHLQHKPGEPTIGASRQGERYVPPSFNEMMAMKNPLLGVAEHVMGAARPPSVYAQDPTGVDTWLKNPSTQQPPLMNATTEEVGTLGRGLYSRIDELLGQVPERGVHPNKLASLLKSGASQEEVAYRNIPALITGKGNQPITRAELAAHLSGESGAVPRGDDARRVRQPA